MCIANRVKTIAIFNGDLSFSFVTASNPINSKQFAILGPIRPHANIEFLDVYRFIVGN